MVPGKCGSKFGAFGVSVELFGMAMPGLEVPLRPWPTMDTAKGPQSTGRACAGVARGRIDEDPTS